MADASAPPPPPVPPALRADAASLVESLRRRFEDAVPATADPKYVRSGTEPQVRVPAALFQRIALSLKEEYGFDLLNALTAVDYPKEERFELVAHFVRTEDPAAEIWVKTSLPRSGEPEAPSLAPVYAAADWQEREIYDLFGIRFKGHPNMRRILLWEGYPGWPLRKDYVHTPDRYDNGREIGLPKGP